MCPSQRVDLPLEVRELGIHYKEIEKSISVIKKVLDDLETDELLGELKHISNFVSRDFAEISQTLYFLESNYNVSLNFFQSFDTSLQTIHQVYTGNRLHILVYVVLFVIGTLLAIKILSMMVQCVKVYPLITGVLQDFREFCQTKQNAQNRNIENDRVERVKMPLV